MIDALLPSTRSKAGNEDGLRCETSCHSYVYLTLDVDYYTSKTIQDVFTLY